MKLFEHIGQVFSGHFLREAGELVDRFVTTKEERLRLKQGFEKIVLERQTQLQRLYNADRASARALQKSALAQHDTFSKRFVYYLAALWSIAGIAYVFLITFTEVISERAADTVLGFLMGTIVSTIINYFYGSAVTSDSPNPLKNKPPHKP